MPCTDQLEAEAFGRILGQKMIEHTIEGAAADCRRQDEPCVGSGMSQGYGQIDIDSHMVQLWGEGSGQNESGIAAMIGRTTIGERVWDAMRILDAVLAEEGCHGYDYYLSDADASELLLIEAWETKHHQKVHIEQPHMARLRSFKGEYIETTTLKEFELK